MAANCEKIAKTLSPKTLKKPFAQQNKTKEEEGEEGEGEGEGGKNHHEKGLIIWQGSGLEGDGARRMTFLVLLHLVFMSKT